VKRNRWALACAVAAAALSLIGLTTLPAKADGPAKSWISEGAGKCLGVLGGNMSNCTPVVQWACNGHADQQWFISTLSQFGVPGPLPTAIRNSANPNKCLGVSDAATNDGANLVIWDCNWNLDQGWIFKNIVPVSRGVPFGCWSIENQNAPGKVIGILGASQSDGAQAVLWDNLRNPDQEFC
jgi:uncharacterized membrane protein